MKKIYLLFLLLCTAAQVFAQTYRLSGRITDGKNTPVPFTSVYIRNTTYGTTANEDGEYEFKLQAGTYNVVYRYVGYLERVEKVTIANGNVERNVQLVNEEFVLEPSDPNAEASKDDPAVNIMRQVIAKREHYLNEVNTFSCVAYVKGVQRLVSAPKKLLGRDVSSTLQIDTNRRSYLYQSESLSKYNFQNPNRVKEEMIASKTAGQSTAFSYNKASDLQANFYKNKFEIQGVSSRAFVSPFADNALKFYDFKLLGTSVKSGRRVDKIQVIPKRERDAVYKGNVYVVEGDWRIYGVDLYLTKKANLNLVDTLQISQQYIPVTDSVWMPISVQYTYNGDVLGFKYQGYYLAVYNNYKINPTFPKGYFNGEVMRVDTQANAKSRNYWMANRPVPLTDLEAVDYKIKDSLAVVHSKKPYLDSLERSRNSINWLTYVVFGSQFYDRNTRQSLYLYPGREAIYYNTVEGYGINAKVSYIKGFDNGQSYTIVPNLRYGFGNKTLSANIGATYNYDPTHQGAFYTRFGSDILDLNYVSTRSLFFNSLSTLLSENNYVKLYRTKFGLVGWQRELANGILFNGHLSYAERQQMYNTSFNHWKDVPDKRYTANNPLADPPEVESQLFPTNQALTLRASLTFTFRQQYITRPDGKYYEPSIFPKVRLNYRKGINSVFGSDVNYDFVSLDVFDDKLPIGLIGNSAFKITAGTFLNHKQLYFVDYNHFLGNQGTVFNPTIGNFHFLDFYDFSTDRSFIEAHYEHNFAGNFLNHVPLIRKLKLEEVVGVNYLAQARHDNYSGVGNNPNLQSIRSNYSEFYIGVQRFIFRIDYGVSFEGSRKLMQGFRIFYGIR
ncbi:DUF5686 and carboxypeptidase regulatory-like domain-containing protein [Mucilaginibacter lacusdianchii]|uniref:DUF5686 and carboxypeptidase regulatory-like domain-containing protein n=1 Tax=Mucilaginibacter lacusdianchii TaxID=2684211 RepID=UPI00131EA423|nr:DUF5686 and carboxypeptidase regulatory-like domain-containing protein [Mucilaginibacter sp. JXJ CY 39]